MHPAASIITFTTLSGLGFGLLVFLGLGFPPVEGLNAFIFFAVAFALAVGGLISSTFHLGHPERALKAFTQWRTSWLSREGWAAVITLSVMGLFAGLIVLFDLRIAPLGWLGALACLATVYITSMIYGSIRSVPRWAHWSTSAMFLAYALSGGALLSGQVPAAIILLALTGIGQFVAWQAGDARFAASGSTAETATGLGHIGKVRLFEAPHSGGNYLTKEMVFVIGRKHADAPYDDGSDIWDGLAAQRIFDDLPGELRIKPVKVGFAAFYESLGRVDLMDNHPDEKPVFISGRQVREELIAGKLPDPRIMRPATAKILIEKMHKA